MKTLEN